MHTCTHGSLWATNYRGRERSTGINTLSFLSQASFKSEHICSSTCVGQHKLKFRVCWCVCFLEKTGNSLQVFKMQFSIPLTVCNDFDCHLQLSSAHYRWQSHQKDCANKYDFNQPPDNSHPSLMSKQYVKSADSVRLICGKQKLIMWQSNRVPSRFKTDWGALSDRLIPSPSISCCQKRLYQSQDMCSSMVMYSKRSYFNSIQPSEGG